MDASNPRPCLVPWLSNGTIFNDLEWPWVTVWNIQWHEAARDLSPTAELLVTECCSGNRFQRQLVGACTGGGVSMGGRRPCLYDSWNCNIARLLANNVKWLGTSGVRRLCSSLSASLMHDRLLLGACLARPQPQGICCSRCRQPAGGR